MTRITGDDFMLVGLHKMAAERGDGLIPEMLDVLKRSREALSQGFDQGAELVQFPEHQAEPSNVAHTASNENNVIAFPVARRRVMRR